jgi:general secretion pathway protein F
MAAFHYLAANLAGKEQKGIIEADSEKHARQLLRAKTLFPISVKVAQHLGDKTKPTTKFFNFKTKSSLSHKELALFTSQFATLLSAGLPVEESLYAVSEQTEKANIKSLILSVRAKIMEGHSLAAALKDHPQAFSNLYCATIAAGEKTGHLDQVLLRLADYTEQQWHMQQKLKTALIYPAMIVLVAIGIVGFLLEYVVPKMVTVYSHLNQALPVPTQILLSISALLKSYGLVAVIMVIAFIVMARKIVKKNELLRAKIHRFLLTLPLIGYAIRTANTARFARTLSILSASGVPVLEAMGIASQLITTIPIQKAVTDAVHRVREGTAISLALKQTHYFPPMSIHMVASGEASGKLESMLGRVAEHQENDIIRLIDVGLALFEPLIILLMGAVVLFIVLAVLMPIFQMNQFAG